MKNRTVIVSGGDIDTDSALDFLKKNIYDNLIGADRGIEFLASQKLTPSHIVGDFDSSDKKVLSYFRQQGEVEIYQYRPEKDLTDTEIAVNLAVKLKSKSITILGATGTRIDHVLANISILTIPLKLGIACTLLDKHNRIVLKDRSFTLEKKDQYGKFISFFPFGGPVEGLTLRGVHYPLTEYLLSPGDPICVSNEIVEKEARISFSKGTLIMVESLD